jgi:signal transduction histidine kinase
MAEYATPPSPPELRSIDPPAIAKILATIAHDLRNPLTTILLGLRHCYSLSLPDLDRLRIELALSEAQRLQQTIDNLLDCAHLTRLDRTEIELNAFAAEIITLFASIPKNADRSIDYSRSDLPMWIWGDRSKLIQAVINLLDNACEATPTESPITWKTIPNPDERTIAIEIHNWGEPIPPQFLPDVTTPFWTTKSTGHGLGLAIVQQIVTAHQGRLEITSTATAGTTVRIELPLLVN